MTFRWRVHTIYKKELVDILRDRRTLIAMIVVPIVLYPLLMLGSIQAISYQTESLGQEEFLIGVVTRQNAYILQELIDKDAAALKQEREELNPESEEARDLPADLKSAKIQLLDSREELEKAVQQRRIQVGIIFEHGIHLDDINQQTRACLFEDSEEVRSGYAASRLTEMLRRTGERAVRNRLARQGLPDVFVEPFDVSFVNLSAPSSILGQILPLILILMTITGAIYPAIDLTAGERERGTLESLMVSPVPVFELIVGKFLVVTTVAIMGATLNLASVTATVWFGGFDVLAADTEGGIPIGKMIVILLCLIPFAVLMSAIMIAVCSYARTFKEAQNYVTPVILAVLIPGGIAALPAARLEGVMLVVPVGNMVLFAREMLLGAAVPWWQTTTVLASTTLYAAAAVAIAASVFGRESVVFADAGSLKATFSRRLIRPSDTPTISMSLLLVALLFPVWFFVQSALSPAPGEDARGLLFATAWLMPLLFVVLPGVILLYWKVDVANTWALRMPSVRHVLAALLIGATAWIPAHELNVFQSKWFAAPKSVLEGFELLGETLGNIHPAVVILFIAIIPAVCEELLFRGVLLRGMGSSARKWSAIVVSAVVFGVFHFFLFKFAVTAALGIVLGYLCWQSRSILPAMLAHALHNGVAVLTIIQPDWAEIIGIPKDLGWSHLPVHVVVVGLVLFILGCLLASRTGRPRTGLDLPR